MLIIIDWILLEIIIPHGVVFYRFVKWYVKIANAHSKLNINIGDHIIFMETFLGGA